MPFLALNGVTVPTAKGGTVEVTEIGYKSRAFDGTSLRDVRAFKRKWAFQTKPVTELRALSLIGLIEGQGFYLPYDSDLYTKNGFGYSGAIPLLSSSTAADGALIYDENAALWTRSISGGAVSVDGTQMNLISASMSAPTSATGFGADAGSSISLDTANKFTGTSSLKVTTAASVGFGMFMSTQVTGAFNTTYTATVYFKSPSSVNFIFKDSANNVISNMIVTPASSTIWKRGLVTITTPASGSTPALQILAVSTTATSFTFYMGGLQIEAAPAPNSWASGGSTRTSTNISYPANPQGTQGLTVNWWQTKPLNSSINMIPWSAQATSSSYQVVAYVPAGNRTLYNFYTQNNAINDTLQISGLTYTGWHMVTLVVRLKPSSGEYSKYLYFDGVLKGQNSAASSIPTNLTAFWVGNNRGNAADPAARVDDMQVLPYPVDANTVAGWFTGATIGATPFISATGNALQDATGATVAGQINKIDMVGFADANGWHANGRVISFTLEEV